jgi:hypothetical protein
VAWLVMLMLCSVIYRLCFHCELIWYTLTIYALVCLVCLTKIISVTGPKTASGDNEGDTISGTDDCIPSGPQCWTSRRGNQLVNAGFVEREF